MLFRSAPPRTLLPRASNGPGDVRLTQYMTLQSEILAISEEITALVTAGTVEAGQILVLTPRKKIGLAIKERLRAAGVAVQSCFQEDELESPNAQEKLAILKLVVNRYDRASLRWLLGCKSSTYLSKQYRRLKQHCAETGAEPWDVLIAQAGGNVLVNGITNLVRRFNEISKEIAPFGDGQGFNIDAWVPDGVEDTSELRALAIRFKPEDGVPLNAADLLEGLIVSITQPEIPEVVEEVRVMSLHKSKVLSAHCVFVSGCVDGLLPRREEAGVPPAEELRLMEEQRRLFFVAITRVKADPPAGRVGILRVSSCARMTFGDVQQLGAITAPGAFGGFQKIGRAHV